MKITEAINPLRVYRKRDRIVPRLKGLGRRAGLPMDADDRRLRALRDAHRGRRAFVVGNGPSLRVEDLDILQRQGEITFAANKIYLAFDQTDWRPSYYGAEDIVIFQNEDAVTAIGALDDRTTRLFPDRDYVPRFPGSLRFRLVYEDRYPGPPSFSTNPVRCVYGGNTVLYTLLQFALYMGIKDVYLLGVDFNYQAPKEVVETYNGVPEIYRVGQERNHFHPDYLKPGELMSDPNLPRHEKSYWAARRAFEAAGGRIANATRGGKLEIFPRVDFDTLFPSSETNGRTP